MEPQYMISIFSGNKWRSGIHKATYPVTVKKEDAVSLLT